MDITIIGAGFAALSAIEQIRKISKNASVRVIAPESQFTYFPSLIWLPSGLRQRGSLHVSLQNYFAKHKVEFIKASVTDINNCGRTVVTDIGTFNNDGLIIAAGARFSRQIAGSEHVIMPCCGIEPSEQIRDQLDQLSGGTIAVGAADNPAEAAGSRGAGPILEFLLGIDTLLRRQKRREQFKLVFFQANPDFAWQFGSDASDKFSQRMRAANIELQLGSPLLGFAAKEVQLENQTIAADMIIFQPPMCAPDWLTQSQLPKSAGGFIQADQFAQVAGWEKTFVAGDIGSFAGEGCPDWQMKLGYAGELQAKAAAQNLLADLGVGSRTVIKFELVYMVDALNSGTLVKRNRKAGKILPPLSPFHYAKRTLEALYLRKLG